MKEATLYKRVNADNVQCLACKQYCEIAPGHTGICGVRQNKDGRLYLLVYGKVSAVNIDPVEKKPLYHFLPGSEIYSIGTVGCNFSCAFCQNWDLSQVTKELRSELLKNKKPELMDVKVGEFGYELLPEKIIQTCVEKKIPSIAYTYNEPTIFFEYLYDTAQLANKEGIKNVMVSNGYMSDEAFEKLHGVIDAINIDLKAFTDEFYRRLSRAHLQPVLDSIKHAYELGMWIELTTLLIPGQNDSDKEVERIAQFIAGISKDIPWHISAFYPHYKMQDFPPTSRESLNRAYDIGKKAGLRYVYVGNVLDDERSVTICPRCGARLISRSGYSIKIENLKDGKCTKCGLKIPGIWK